MFDPNTTLNSVGFETERLPEPLLRREVESLRPPRSGEVICCLAGIMGKSRDSGFRLGLDARADNGTSSAHPERLEGNQGTPSHFQDQG